MLESDLFFSMFTENYLENKNIIKIDDFEYYTIFNSIKYIYTNKIDLDNFENLLNFFEFSNYYQIDKLKNL